MKLIIVESPAKARTIARFLPADYKVTSSYGHIRDLPGSAGEIPAKFKQEPWARLGVDPDNSYTPIYVVSPDSKKQVAELRKLVKEAGEILLATDEDREGEAISWHLLEVLKPTAPVNRITFHEITKDAILAALEAPRQVDMKLVRAQEGRRILDRLYGYSLSPVLWKKVRTKLSAGRVQSVAVRLVVEKEEERQAFHEAEYFDIEALLVSGSLHFTAHLAALDDVKLAGGKDFDPASGRLVSGQQRVHLQEDLALQLAELSRNTVPWLVKTVTRKETRQSPAPPFTTSTLQQAASGRLRLSPQRVMRVAQRLYEGIPLAGGVPEGLITYMRTDSLTLSEKALAEAEAFITRTFGKEFTQGPRRYKTRAKGAQEAHEAIRPTSVERTPANLASFLSSEDLAVYQLIWNRAVASQMANALLDKTTIDFEVAVPGHSLLYRANGSVIRFPGYLEVYGQGTKDSLLPDLPEGTEVGPDSPIPVEIREVDPLRHETQPPARYTEASLIKKLEDEGIGRPSTYASVISTIQSRGYVEKKAGALLPSYIGIAVTHLLRQHFARYVDVQFTARMEEGLDRIAAAEVDLVEFLDGFYRGEANGTKGLEKDIEAALDNIEFPRIKMGEDPATGEPIVLRIGRNYVYVEMENDPQRRASVPLDLLIDELSPAKALELIAQRDRSRAPIGQHPETGQNIYALAGPYGPYLQLGENDADPKPKRISLGRKTDLATIDLAYALRLLSLPREVGADPETGKKITAGLGRFGPYVQLNRVFASVNSVDTLFTITLEEALDRIRNKNRKPVLKELGPHPETGAALQVLKGRYGPYVTDGQVNATLGKDAEPEDLTLEEAVSLLQAAAARKPASSKSKKKVSTRKSGGRKKAPTGKTPAKRTTKKKTRAKTTPAGK